MSAEKELQPHSSQRPTSLEYEPLALYKIKKKSTDEIYKAKGLRRSNQSEKFESHILQSAKESSLNQSSMKHCKFLIGISMYNESWDEFSYTLKAVNDNLQAFYEHEQNFETDQIICVVIVDGIRPFLETYNKTPEMFGKFFDIEKVKNAFNVDDLTKCNFEEYLHENFKYGEEDEYKETKIHNKGYFEDPEIRFREARKGNKSDKHEKIEFAHVFSQKTCFGKLHVPLNLILCVKQYNKRKLNSHLWLFGGFCHEIQPDYVMLLDVGTRPLKNSLYYLYEAMQKNPNLAGCCGEIKPMNPKLWNLVVQAQVVEYKFSHMLDKALESIIGFITVLPGAFSAYRWEALQGRPLWKDYFKSIFSPASEMDTFKSNIYLAEDRVLCLSLVSTKNKKYVLRYVKQSVAETDVPENLSVLLAQRRRWINGSWFALIDTLIKSRKLLRTNHSICRKFLFFLQTLYYLINAVYTWFIVGMFYVGFVIAIRYNHNNDAESTQLSNAGDWIILVYTSLIVVLFVTSMGVKPKKVQNFYRVTSYTLGLLQFYIIYIIIKIFSETDIGIIFLFSLISGFGTFGLIILINCEVTTILKGFLHYIFMTPTYINIFIIYSICNTHDCTWGNRPDSLNREELDKVEDFENFRTRWANIWGLSNVGFVFLLLHFTYSASDVTSSYYYLAIGGIGAITVVIRFFGGVVYWLIETCRKKSNKQRDIKRSSTFEESFLETLSNNQ